MMSEGIKLKLFPYQVDIVKQFGKRGGRLISIEDTGAGKTIIALSLIKAYKFKRALIISKSLILEDGFMTALENFDYFESLDIARYQTGKPVDKNKGLMLSYGQIKGANTKQLGSFDCLILDEVHLVKNSSGSTWKELSKLISKYNPKARYLTAAPVSYTHLTLPTILLV